MQQYACEYLDETVAPKMVKEQTGIEKGEFVSDEYEVEVEHMLREYQLTNVNPSTVYRWLIKLVLC
jgi:hypothetical protein